MDRAPETHFALVTDQKDTLELTLPIYISDVVCRISQNHCRDSIGAVVHLSIEVEGSIDLFLKVEKRVV